MYSINMYRGTQTDPSRIVEEIGVKEAVAEYLDANAKNLSEHTISDYGLTLRRLCASLDGNPAVHEINHRQIRKVLAAIPGGNKNASNAWIGLSAFWTWCVKEGYANEQVVHRVDKPKPDETVIEPFEYEEVVDIINATKRTRNSLRNMLMICMFLDNGMRATEMSNLTVHDLRLPGSANSEKEELGHTEANRFIMRRYRESAFAIIRHGKGGKGRTVPVSERLSQELNQYICSRNAKPTDPIFPNGAGKPLTRYGINDVMDDLEQISKVYDVHAHRFRHTFAINYLMNGGDAYTLQKILGHASMEMVRKYLDLADRRIAEKHAVASPVVFWNLYSPHGSHP